MLGVQAMGPLAPGRVGGGVAGGAGAPPRVCEPQAQLASPEEIGKPVGPVAEERDAWVVLLTTPGLGPITFTALLTAFGSARAAVAAARSPQGASRLREALASREGDAAVPEPDGAPDPVAPAACSGEPAGPRRRPAMDLAARIRDHADVAGQTLDAIRSLGLTVVTLDDPGYPDRLRRVDMPPPLLFVSGSLAALSAASAVAVVGTRRPTDRGRQTAAWIGSALARAGAVVVSGLAVGIDGAAHAAVVSEGLPTVAVLGGGHARLFPMAHERLADQIVAAGGAVVAELPPETPATRGTFPRRNRLVSGLSDATVVVEAGARSGALITAGWALEQGRECFLVPGPIDAPASAGCLAFLRSFPGQTRVVCGIPELLEDLQLVADAGQSAPDAGEPEADATGRASGRRSGPGAAAPGAGRAAILASLGPAERAVARLVAGGAVTADQLAAETDMPGAAVLSALTLLELRGLVVGSWGRYVASGPLARWDAGDRPG